MLELKMGVELSLQKDGIDRTKQLNHFLEDINILPINDAIDIAAQEKIRLRLAGTPCEDNFDLLIACTAIANDMICVTDNTKDFHRFAKIELENWVIRPGEL
jgi:tRNA(fMet)-specific endonuclease VapC